MKGMVILATKEAKARATAKYEAKAYDKVLLRMPKGKKEQISATGESLNGYINKAIDERLERDQREERAE